MRIGSEAFGAALAETENTVVPIAASDHREPDDVTLHYSSSGPQPLGFSLCERQLLRWWAPMLLG